MDDYSIEDLKALISLLTIEDTEAISKSDLLMQLDHLRDVRLSDESFPFTPSESTFSVSSPEFVFQRPIKIPLRSNASVDVEKKVDLNHDTQKNSEKKVAGRTIGVDFIAPKAHLPQHSLNVDASNEPAIHHGGFNQKNLEKAETTFQLNHLADALPDTADFNMGLFENKGGKKGTRPRRGGTPHKTSPTKIVKANVADFIFSTAAKENREPNRVIFSAVSTDFLFGSKGNGLPSKKSDSESIPQPFEFMMPDIKNLNLTPQSTNSAMELDGSLEEGQDLESTETFQPKNLNFAFKAPPTATFGDIPMKEGIPINGLFHMGACPKSSRKKKEVVVSPGLKRQMETVNVSTLNESLASVTLDELKVDTSYKMNEAEKKHTDTITSPFSEWWSSTDKANAGESRTREEATRAFADTVGGYSLPSNMSISSPLPSTSDVPPGPFFFDSSVSPNRTGPFTSKASAVKIVRPSTPKKATSYVRMKKTPLREEGSTKSEEASPASQEMDVDGSRPQSPISPVSVRKLSRSPVTAQATPLRATPSRAPLFNMHFTSSFVSTPLYRASNEDDSDTEDTPMNPIGRSKFAAEKESCAPTSVYKPLSRIIPDESPERMNDLANQYRKQGGDHYSREQYGQAQDCFEKSLKYGSATWANRSTVLGNKAATLMMLGRYLEAADDCLEAIRVDPNMAKLHSRRGRALIRLGRFSEASDAFSTLLEANCSTLYDLEAAMADARSGQKTLTEAKNSMKRLSQLEVTGDFQGVLTLLEDLSAKCPSCAVVFTSKCNVLCKLFRWGEAKACAEEFICTAHVTVQRLTAHVKAVLPCPSAQHLQWTEKAKSSTVTVDVSAVVQAVLAMGPDLGKPYVCALKNIEGCPNSCADAMLHVLVLLTQLQQIITSDSTSCNRWSWVGVELKNCTETAHWKDMGDKQYRKASVADAVLSYTHAINAEPSALKWSAILYNNRAAANMALGRLSETIADCHQAISRDPGYAKAYLRRARALSAARSFAACIRDFRHYLASKPCPTDSAQVFIELEAVVEANKREARGDAVRNAWESRGEEQKRAGVEKSIPKGWGSSIPKSRYSSGCSGTGSAQVPKTTSSASARAKNSQAWDSDEEAFLNKAKQQHYQKCKATANPRNPPEKTFGNSRSRVPRSEESYSEEEIPYFRSKSDGDSKSSASAVKNGGTGCHYHTLGVDSSSSERQIKVAYRKLALKFHPDKNKEDGAEDQFKAITSAYSVIIDKTTRDQYDRERRVSTRSMW